MLNILFLFLTLLNLLFLFFSFAHSSLLVLLFRLLFTGCPSLSVLLFSSKPSFCSLPFAQFFPPVFPFFLTFPLYCSVFSIGTTCSYLSLNLHFLDLSLTKSWLHVLLLSYRKSSLYSMSVSYPQSCLSVLLLPHSSFHVLLFSSIFPQCPSITLNVLCLPSTSFVYPQCPSFTLNVLHLPSIFSRCPSFYSILPPCPALTLMMNVFIVREIRLEIAQRTVKYLCSLI